MASTDIWVVMSVCWSGGLWKKIKRAKDLVRNISYPSVNFKGSKIISSQCFLDLIIQKYVLLNKQRFFRTQTCFDIIVLCNY